MFLLMTDGAWHCQGTVGQACASSMPPAPLLCTPPHKLKHTHALPRFLNWPISLEHWRTTSPLLPHLLCACLSLPLSQSLFLFLSLSLTHTYTLACHSSSSTHCEDDCLWTDIHDTGRMSWINCICVGIDSINRLKLVCHNHNSREKFTNCFVMNCPLQHPGETKMT